MDHANHSEPNTPEFRVKDQKLSEESSVAAERICKSVEYARSWKPFGSMCLHLALPIAFGISSEDVQVWTHRALKDLLKELRFSHGMAALGWMFEIMTWGSVMKA